jgi:DNA-binding HxlR family transcriptional regulator
MRPLFDDAYCAEYTQALELIGRRWTGAIIRAMFCGHSRFTELADIIPNLSDRLLALRLKELEVEGVIQCQIPSGQNRGEYVLTDKGMALARVLKELNTWSKTWHVNS